MYGDGGNYSKNTTATSVSITHSPSSSSRFSYLHIGTYIRPKPPSLLGLGFQERFKWDGSSSSSSFSSSNDGKIRAESNCPRRSDQINFIFSNRGDSSGYQALNLCPNCKTAYYIRPHKLVPLQGRFEELGRLKGTTSVVFGDEGDRLRVGRLLPPKGWEVDRLRVGRAVFAQTIEAANRG